MSRIGRCRRGSPAIADALDAAGFATERSQDIRLDVWIKLLGNLSFNPVAALTGYLMNQIVADEDVLGVIRAMMRRRHGGRRSTTATRCR